MWCGNISPVTAAGYFNLPHLLCVYRKVYTRIQAEFLTLYSKLKSRGSAYLRIIEAWPHKAGCYLHVCVIFCPHSVGMLLFTYQGKDWHSFTPSVCLTEVWKATVDKRMVSKGMWLSQYAPKGVKSLCITSSQTVYVRKPYMVSSKTLERLGGRLMCEIYLNTYFQRARLGGRLMCEIYLNTYFQRARLGGRLTVFPRMSAPVLIDFKISVPRSSFFWGLVIIMSSFDRALIRDPGAQKKNVGIRYMEKHASFITPGGILLTEPVVPVIPI